MAEPRIDVVRDFLQCVGCLRAVTVEPYVASADGWSGPVPAMGTRDSKRVTADGVADGTVAVTRTTWWLAAVGLARPPLRSKVNDTGRGEVWVVERASPDPLDGVYEMACVLA